MEPTLNNNLDALLKNYNANSNGGPRQSLFINAMFTDEPQTVVHEKKLKKNKRVDKRREYPDDSSYISISNPSLRDAVVEVEEEEDLSLAGSFDFDQMRRSYERYQVIANNEGVDLLPETLQFVKEVFALLTENDDEIAEQLYDSIMSVDETYPRRFVEYAHIINPNLGFLTTIKSRARDHMVQHLKKILEFHRITVKAFLENREQADHLLHLLGLSHYLMRVSVDDFDMLSLTCLKLLLHINVCNEENVIHAVGYFCTVTKYVRQTIDEYYRGRENLVRETERYNNERRQLEYINSSESFENNESNSLDESLALILSKGGTVNLWARKNYRAMKDWEIIKEEIRRVINIKHPFDADTMLYIERVHGESSTDKGFNKIVHKVTTSDNDTDGSEEKTFLNWLKKGYKFKDNDDILYIQDKL